MNAFISVNTKNLEVTRCETGISGALGNRIIRVWRDMLLRTHYSSREVRGYDGVRYHFSLRDKDAGFLSGQVWSPDDGTATAALVDLGEQMRAVCVKSGAPQAGLERMVAQLEQRLARQEKKK